MKKYKNRQLDQISYPLGGIGAGMICLEGTGAISNISVRHRPDMYKKPNMFAAVTIKNNNKKSIVLEGQVPIPKYCGIHGSGNGMITYNYGLPRFRECSFSARFPFAHLELTDAEMPISVNIEGFSPFIPGKSDECSLPVASIKYTINNTTNKELEGVFYFSSMQFMGLEGGEEKRFIKPFENGFLIEQEMFDDAPHTAGTFAITADCDAMVDADYYRGEWWDSFTMCWNKIAEGKVNQKHAQDMKSPGAMLAIPFKLKANESKTITLHFCWYVPNSNERIGIELEGQEKLFYRPWYAGKYKSIFELVKDYKNRHSELYLESKKFSDALYASSLPEEIVEAIAANLSILKSPTVLRQEDGRFWAWEGCAENHGCCEGSCTHVWNYAQALCHLLPDLEMSLREVEFCEDMDENGHQQFRSSLPIRKNGHNFHAASDGQPGGIIKMYREWRISGDTEWITSYWDKIVCSMEYCIRTWDKNEEGTFKEPHHNTYDIEFWGADGMCTSFYLGALKAITEIGKGIGKDVTRYENLYYKGKEYMENVLWNGEYFIQIPQWTDLEADFNANGDSLLEKEGPKYQYGTGCLSDGICGAWLAKVCGLGDILDPEKTKSHLLSVYKYNLRKDLSSHANTQRPGYALGQEGGLLLCSWPYGDKPSIPFVYSDEVWTGIEYQVAAHLASFGYTDEALDIVTTLRGRYNGEKRNPYDEYEWGHWYARALASYSLLNAYTGVRYDAVSKTLYAGKGDYTVFLATQKGYGLVKSEAGKIELKIVSGEIPIEQTVVV